jgi:hypothetical protein
VDALAAAAAGLDEEARLPLLEVAAAALGTMSADHFDAFAETVRGLVEGDRVVELGEWVLSRLLLRHLRERLAPAPPPRARYRSVAAFRDEAAVLLSALAYAGHDDDADARAAFAAAAAEIGLSASPCGRSACPPRALEASLDTFSQLVPEEKRRLVAACAASVAADDRITPREAELFRVVADWLGAPVPPVLPGEGLA